MKRRYVLKNKTRFFLFILSCVLLVTMFVFTNAAYGYKDTAYQWVTVRQGDTLWSISSRYNPNSDIREYIYKIKKHNNLASNEIYEGEQLKLPIHE